MKKTYWLLIGLFCLTIFAFSVHASTGSEYPITDISFYKQGIVGMSWNTVRTSNSTDNYNTATIELMIGSNKVHITYKVVRWFAEFNVSNYDISVVQSAELHIKGYFCNDADICVIKADGISNLNNANFSVAYSSEFTGYDDAGWNVITLNSNFFDALIEKPEHLYICVVEYDYDYLEVTPDAVYFDGGYNIESGGTDNDPYLTFNYTSNLPPVVSNPVNGSGETINFPKPNLAFDVNDPEGDIITYYVKFESTIIISEDTTGNTTIYYNEGEWEDNIIVCLGATYDWYVYTKDATSDYLETHYTVKFDIAPRPLEGKYCSYSYYWKQVGNWNSTDTPINEYRLVNDTNNYSWYDAVDNSVVVNRTYYFNEDWETWVFNNTVPAYDGVLIALNDSGYHIYHSVPVGGGDCSFSDKSGFANYSNGHGDYVNLSFNVDYDGSDITVDTIGLNTYYLYDSVQIMTKANDYGWTSLWSDGYFVLSTGEIGQVTVTDHSDMDFSQYYNSTDECGFYINHSWQSHFTNGVMSWDNHNVLDNITCNGTGSGNISFPLYYNFSFDYLTANVTCQNETNATMNYSISDEGYISISSFSLAPELTLVLFMGLFFWFAQDRKSAFLFILCGILSFVTGIYYVLLELSATYTIIGVSIIGFSIYCMFLSLAHYKRP